MASALAGWLSWLECHLVHQKVVGSIPGQGAFRRQPMMFLSHIDVSLSPPLSLPFSFSKIDGHILRGGFKNNMASDQAVLTLIMLSSGF